MTSSPAPTGRSIGGKIGGLQTLKRHGVEFLRTIGRKGGKAKKRTTKQA